VLIIAGPGSGKTRTLTHRIAYLLATGRARPWQVLALTFTNKAAREMQERIRSLVGETAARALTMGTFHSVFARLLRVEAGAIGYSRDFSIYDPDDTERVLKSLMERFRIDPKQHPVRGLRGLISSAKNSMVGPQEYGRFVSSEQQEKAATLYGPYEELLRQSNAMDFDDLLLKPIQLFEQHPQVLAKYQDKWRYLHIDEYQDTNHAQYLVAKLLAAAHRNLCVVGDDAQSIYAFRGADISNILSFQRDYPKATTVRLEQNYRSTGRILQLAQSIIERNKDQLKKTLRTDNREGDFVYLFEAPSDRDEAYKVERTIRDLMAREGHRYRDFAVLYRTNAQSRGLEETLRRAGIPYRLVGGVSFYSRKEIKDALAYLRLLVNPHDAASLRRVINYPARGIGDTTLEKLAAHAQDRGLTLWQTLEKDALADAGIAGRAGGAIERFRFMIARHSAALTSQKADAVARDVLSEAGLFTEFRQENTPESQARMENVEELLNGLAEHVQGGEERSLATFLQEVTLYTDADQDETDPNRVTLMTLHASKGLEFPVVFIVGLEENLFPLAKAAQDAKDLEEERRLFYVGATRAQDRLFLSYARTRFRYGQAEPSVRSRFLEELDETVVRTETGGMFQSRPDRFRTSLDAPTRGKSAPKGRTGDRRIEYDDEAPRERPQATKPGGVSYAEMDPHYYRQSLTGRTSGRPAPPPGQPLKVPRPGERRVEYDDGAPPGGPLVPGVRVRHSLFGDGKVLALEGKGDQANVTVFFKNVGQKKLKVRFAALTVVG
jgi:DNA helicase II / ATP-dependent DNA helicase PcrA